MKKLNFALLLAFALSAVLISCGGGGGGGGGGAAPSTTDSSNTTTSTTTTSTSSTTTTTTAPTTPIIQQVPAGKVLVNGSKIEIAESVVGATIYYTLDGTEPTSSSSVYTASKVTINSSCTLKAVAIKDGISSNIASTTYTVIQRKATPDAVNDIVFKDSTAVAYSSDLYFTDNVKADALAMIFYKGTECSNDGSNRTLGVGLDIVGTGRWCLSSANGYATNITTIQCTPSGSSGSYTFTGDKNGSDNLSQIATFLAGSNDTGIAANYPAFYWAKNYGTVNGCTGAYTNGWYLPSIAELYQIWKMKANIDAVIAFCGLTGRYTLSGNVWFKSSSQYASDDNKDCLIDFPNGACIYYEKDRIHNLVCAIREF